MRYRDPQSTHRSADPHVFYGEMIWLGPEEHEFSFDDDEGYLDAISDIDPGAFYAAGTFHTITKELVWSDPRDFSVHFARKHHFALKGPFSPFGRGDIDTIVLGEIPWVMV